MPGCLMWITGKEPEKYHVGKGEQGVLICEPYKSEIGRYWRFKTSEIAAESSQKIYTLFLDYLQRGEFVPIINLI